ncbi:MAG: hypothetical protein KA118_12575 [Verrucomicrobia bacterium]|nr:hypothetical protein [Verrucomicrobiota bacterium]
MERWVERWLHDYSAWRRDGIQPPAAMPPDVRALLHAEIARHWPRPGPPPVASASRIGWLRALWPRMAWAGGFALLAFLLAVAALPRKESSSPTVEAARSLPAADPMPDRISSSHVRLLFERASQAPEPAAKAPRPLPARSRAAAPAAASKPVPASEPEPPATLLARFHWEQDGGIVRVRDTDGSVYVGRAEAHLASPPDPPGPAPTLAAAAPHMPGSNSPMPLTGPILRTAQPIAFTVTGTNRTHRLPVILTGELRAAPASQPLEIRGRLEFGAHRSPFTARLAPDPAPGH